MRQQGSPYCELGGILPKIQGGLGAPDITKYYYATHLRAITSWSSLHAPNQWTAIEKGVLYPVHPCSLVWGSLPSLDLIFKRQCTAPMTFTLTIWRKCLKNDSLTSPCPPLVNVLFNSLIPDSMSLGRVFSWLNAPLFQLRNLVNPITRRLHTFNTLYGKFDILSHLFHFYLQVRRFFHSKSPTLTLDKPTAFELPMRSGPSPMTFNILYIPYPP